MAEENKSNLSRADEMQALAMKSRRSIGLGDLLATRDDAKFEAEIASIKKDVIKNVKQSVPNRFVKLRDVNFSEIIDPDQNKMHLVQRHHLRRIKTKLLKQVKRAVPDRVVEMDALGFHELMEGDSDAARSKLLNFRYRMMKHKVLSMVKRSIPKKVDPTEGKDVWAKVMGETPQSGIIARFQFRSLKRKMLRSLQRSVPKEVSFSDGVKISDIMGDTTVSSKKFTKRYKKLQLKLLKIIGKKVKGAAESGDSMSIGGISMGQPAGSGLNYTSHLDTIVENITSINSQITRFIDSYMAGDMKREENRRELVDVLSGISNNSGLSAAAGGGGDKKKGKGLVGKLLGALGLGVAGLAKGVAAIGGVIGKALGGLIGGLLGGASKGLAKLLKSLSNPKYFIGVAVLGALSGVLFVLGKALATFDSKVDWKSLAIGIGTLGVLSAMVWGLSKLGPKMLIGVGLLYLLSGAIWVLGKALNAFTGIDWKAIAIGGVALLGFTAIAAGLGLIAPLIAIGSLVILALGAALWVFSKAMKGFAEAAAIFLPAMGDFITVMADGTAKVFGAIGETIVAVLDGIATTFERLAAVSGAALIDTSKGIGAIAVAMLGFSTATIGAAIGNLVNKFLGNDPVRRFERFAAIAPGLQLAAQSIKQLGISIKDLDGDALNRGAAALKTFINTIADGFFKKDPLTPLRDLMNILSAADVTQFSALGDVFAGMGIMGKYFNDINYKTMKKIMDLIADTKVDDSLIEFFKEGRKFFTAMSSADLNKMSTIMTPGEAGLVTTGADLNVASKEAPGMVDKIGGIMSAVANSVQTSVNNVVQNSTGDSNSSNFYQNNNVDITRDKSLNGNMW
jgi:hypothetical protein